MTYPTSEPRSSATETPKTISFLLLCKRLGQYARASNCAYSPNSTGSDTGNNACMSMSRNFNGSPDDIVPYYNSATVRPRSASSAYNSDPQQIWAKRAPLGSCFRLVWGKP
ncbi:hypothetical protein AAC387_Pa05g2720 [Persea americana]